MQHYTEDSVEITLIDGDSYEEKNRERQFFDQLGNKAEVTVERLQDEYPDISWKFREEYVTRDNARICIRSGDIVFLCVDNHATRKVVSERCEDVPSCVLISGGNELTDGNIQTFVREDAVNLTLPLTNEYHPEISNPQDKNPGEVSCEEQVVSAPQILIMNNMIAALMLNAFFGYLNNKLNYDEVYVDILSNNTRKVKR